MTEDAYNYSGHGAHSVSELPAHGAHPPGFAHQFEDIEQQRDAGSLGMWVFLVTEILFFGGMFTAYTIYRALHFQRSTPAATCSNYRFGATNTAVLICSSLTMALGDSLRADGQEEGHDHLLADSDDDPGRAFIGIKLRFEWYRDYVEGIIPGVHWFYNGPTSRPACRCSCASISS